MLAKPIACAFALLAFAAATASAQPTFESTGERALGMGGAFLAVANDATATHWNPAGLVHGSPAGMTIGWSRFQSGNQDQVVTPGPSRRGVGFTSLGSWPVGISYGHFEMTNLLPGPDPEVLKTATPGVLVETLRTRQVAATFLQTVVEGLVVGTTLKYVRGSVVTAISSGETVAEALNRTDGLDGQVKGVFDFDIGVMADMDKLRVGVAWKNLQSPEFGVVSTGFIKLPRQARLGIAVLPTDGLTLAMDIDLDTVDLRGDLRRTFALGGEGRIGRRLAVRSGIRWSRVGARRLLGSAGMSISLRQGFWLDGHYTYGNTGEEREYGVAMRAGL